MSNYTPQTWNDFPDTSTPLSAERLNHIEDGIVAVDTALSGVSGAAAAPLQASAHIVGSPIAGGYQTCVVLHPNDTSGQLNIATGTLPPWQYPALENFMFGVVAPVFSTGTLAVDYAELTVANPDGTERRCVGHAGSSLTSGQSVAPLALDDGEEATGAGTDLVINPTYIQTTAGGVYVVSFFVQFTVSADFA